MGVPALGNPLGNPLVLAKQRVDKSLIAPSKVLYLLSGSGTYLLDTTGFTRARITAVGAGGGGSGYQSSNGGGGGGTDCTPQIPVGGGLISLIYACGVGGTGGINGGTAGGDTTAQFMGYSLSAGGGQSGKLGGAGGRAGVRGFVGGNGGLRTNWSGGGGGGAASSEGPGGNGGTASVGSNVALNAGAGGGAGYDFQSANASGGGGGGGMGANGGTPTLGYAGGSNPGLLANMRTNRMGEDGIINADNAYGGRGGLAGGGGGGGGSYYTSSTGGNGGDGGVRIELW